MAWYISQGSLGLQTTERVLSKEGKLWVHLIEQSSIHWFQVWLDPGAHFGSFPLLSYSLPDPISLL